MKSVIYFCTAMLLSVAVSAQWAPVNRNGGFENATAGVVAANIPQWALDRGTEMAVYTIDNSAGNFVGGVQAMRVVVGATAVGVEDWIVQMQHPDLPLDSGKFYRFQVWAKADKPQAHASFSINRGAVASWDEVIRRGIVNLTTSWARYDMSFYTYWGTPDTILSSIHMSLDTNERHFPITFWFDDLTVIQAVTASATVPAAGNQVVLNFHHRVMDGEDTPVDLVAPENFIVIAGEIDVPITAVAIADSIVTLSLGENIPQGATVQVTYDGFSQLQFDNLPKNFAGVGGVPLVPTFSDPVENKSTVTTSVPNIAELNISIWPNPVGEAGMLNIDGVAQINRIDVVSITGQIIRSVSNSSNRASIDVSDLDKGIYVVVLRAENKPVRALRFVR